MSNEMWQIYQILMWSFGFMTSILIGFSSLFWMNMNSKFDKINERFDKIENRLNLIETRLTIVETLIHMKDWYTSNYEDKRKIE